MQPGFLGSMGAISRAVVQKWKAMYVFIERCEGLIELFETATLVRLFLAVDSNPTCGFSTGTTMRRWLTSHKIFDGKCR